MAKNGASGESVDRFGSTLRLLLETRRAAMRKESAYLLFPGKSDPDIFAAVMAEWMRLGEEVTHAEVFARLLRRMERRWGILSLHQVLSRMRRRLFSSKGRGAAFFPSTVPA